MFIRWKRKEKKPKRDWQTKEYITQHYVYAQLTESYREEGKPRQRVVKHLGGFKEHLQAMPHIRSHFWEGVSEKLNELSLSDSERGKIEQQLSIKVPILTEIEREEVAQMRKALWGMGDEIKKLRGM